MQTMETREVARCWSCGLNQFVPLAARECRRCHKPLQEPAPPAAAMEDAEVDVEAAIAANTRMTAFGRRLYRAMKKRGMTQAELSRKSGRNRQHIYKLINGLLKPRLSTCQSLADALGIPMQELAAADADAIQRNAVENEFLMELADALKLVPQSGWPFVLHMAQDLSRGQLTLPEWMTV